MKVKVEYLGLIRQKIGRKEEEYDLTEGSLLRDLLNSIVETHDALKSIIRIENESPIDPTLVVMLNGSSINPMSKKEIALKNGDIVTLMTPIGGGILKA
ncbi:MAG: MoaD/ThiS family protein [Candidatus Bathyarchaeia archaeon]|nr:MoaD/ThiS family protein [Candidatus Bathyarchaeota archaeon]